MRKVTGEVSGRPRLSLFPIYAGLALLLLGLYPRPVQAQGLGGYVQVNSFEKKVTPSQVYKGEKFQGVLRGEATLLKELPVNTNVEADYEVMAKPDTGQPSLVVGRGTLKVGPLPSVAAGVKVTLSETIELLFPESAPPGHYTLVIEATSVRPFIIGMIVDLIFPRLESMSLRLGQVEYLGEKPAVASTSTPASTPIATPTPTPAPTPVAEPIATPTPAPAITGGESANWNYWLITAIAALVAVAGFWGWWAVARRGVRS